MKKSIFFISLVLISLIIILKPMPMALAQEKPKGITVYPSIMHVDLASDPAEYNLTYVNNTTGEINLKLSVEDFTQLEDSYKISFLEGKQAANYKYSLSSWISFANPQIYLNPGEKKTIKVFIDDKRITKGGHYASILAEIAQPENNKQVNIKAILSSLLFVRASTGKEIEEGKISTFLPERDNFDYPNSYVLRFQNNGNVHVIPYGLIEIFDPFGNLAAKGIVNQDSLDALPESIRLYSVSVVTYQKMLLPGLYKAKISLHFGKTNQKLFSEVKFFTQGSFDFIKIDVFLFAIIILLIYYKKRKKNNVK